MSLLIMRIATPIVGELLHQRIDFGLRSDIDSSRGLIKQNELRPERRQPFRQHDFLLIAPLRFAATVSIDGVLMFNTSHIFAAA
jgi:hypothetical protein